jgi:hypothetical protein
MSNRTSPYDMELVISGEANITHTITPHLESVIHGYKCTYPNACNVMMIYRARPWHIALMRIVIFIVSKPSKAHTLFCKVSGRHLALVECAAIVGTSAI